MLLWGNRIPGVLDNGVDGWLSVSGSRREGKILAATTGSKEQKYG